MEKIKWLLGFLIFCTLLIAYHNYPKLNLISGYASKNMATNVFLAHRHSETISAKDHDMPLIKLAHEKINIYEYVATSSFFGLMERKSVFKKGLGAVLTNGEYDYHGFNLVPKRSISTIDLPFPYGNNEQDDTIFSNVDYDKLGKILSNAFGDPDQKTRSLIVVYKDQIIGKKYAQDITKNTPVLGWSMTKSVLATLYGIMKFEGILKASD
ncbi:hypothetical protein ACOCEA_09380 [Maribacter sp. CXY002]|uniref:hypothetical protein n=1 Tax=Maribacter luteocoastalis TaxID=3407671 RepID=UPI003B671EC8